MRPDPQIGIDITYFYQARDLPSEVWAREAPSPFGDPNPNQASTPQGVRPKVAPASPWHTRSRVVGRLISRATRCYHSRCSKTRCAIPTRGLNTCCIPYSGMQFMPVARMLHACCAHAARMLHACCAHAVHMLCTCCAHAHIHGWHATVVHRRLLILVTWQVMTSHGGKHWTARIWDLDP